MPQHDFTIDNQTAQQVRLDINAALQALASLNSGPTQPPTTFAGMLWLDTSPATPVLRVRNATNNGWIEVGELSAAGMNIGGRVQQVVSATAPPNPTPGMQWVDTGQSPPVVRIRNGANSGWIAVAALPDVLLRDGSQPMTGRLLLEPSASGGLGFSGEPGTGVVRTGANVLALRTDGNDRFVVWNTGAQALVPLTVPTATAPGHAVRLDQLPLPVEPMKLVSQVTVTSSVSFVSFTLPDEDHFYLLAAFGVRTGPWSYNELPENTKIAFEVAHDTVPNWLVSPYRPDNQVARGVTQNSEDYIPGSHVSLMVSFANLNVGSGRFRLAEGRSVTISNAYPQFYFTSFSTVFSLPSSAQRIRAIRIRPTSQYGSVNINAGVFYLYRVTP